MGYDYTPGWTEGKDFVIYDSKGRLDDVTLTGVKMFRMERMSDDQFWIRVYRKGGKDIVFYIHADEDASAFDKIICSGMHELDFDDRPAWRRWLDGPLCYWRESYRHVPKFIKGWR